METFSLYLHIPFCHHRCGYCDFNTYAGQNHLIPNYIEALIREIEIVSQSAGEKLTVHTVFFGGGTPSLVPPEQLQAVVDRIRACFEVTPDAEVTLEANPGTVSLETLQHLHRAGFNRISFGMQSAHADELRMLERQHSFEDVQQAVEWARQAGFDNLNLDLIFGLPNHSMDRWQQTVNAALGMHPEHLSLYALTIEHGTPFAHAIQQGKMPAPDDDLAADQYEWVTEYLAGASFEQYEISNWAVRRQGTLLAAQHNLQYWRGLPYLGFGAGAHGYAAGVRTANVLGINSFIKRIESGKGGSFPISPAAAQATPIDRWTAMQEHMMVGLRLTQEGVSAGRFLELFGVEIERAFGSEIERLLQKCLIEWVVGGQDRRLRLTPNGRLLGNQVFQAFIGNPAPEWLAAEA